MEKQNIHITTIIPNAPWGRILNEFQHGKRVTIYSTDAPTFVKLLETVRSQYEREDLENGMSRFTPVKKEL